MFGVLVLTRSGPTARRIGHLTLMRRATSKSAGAARAVPIPVFGEQAGDGSSDSATGGHWPGTWHPPDRAPIPG
jgi:hypothetical protein